jgi:uncharacterized protein with PIN domain
MEEPRNKADTTLDEILGVWGHIILTRREYWVKRFGGHMACFGVYIDHREQEFPVCLESPLGGEPEDEACEECIELTKRYRPDFFPKRK